MPAPGGEGGEGTAVHTSKQLRLPTTFSSLEAASAAAWEALVYYLQTKVQDRGKSVKLGGEMRVLIPAPPLTSWVTSSSCEYCQKSGNS